MKKIIVSALFIAIFTVIFWNLKKDKMPEDSEEVTTSQVVKEIKKVSLSKNENVEVNNQNNISDFQSQIERDLKSLVTIDDLQNLTEDEVHHTPEIIKEGGEIIGKIHRAGELDPIKRVDTMVFFKRCVQDEEIALALRAVCLNKIYKLIPEWKIVTPLADIDIPSEVEDLALKLP